MAYPSTEVDRFRSQVSAAVDSMRRIDALLAIVEDHGVDDAERIAFFGGEFGVDSNNTDITTNEFAQGIQALRDIRTQWETSKYAVAKLIK